MGDIVDLQKLRQEARLIWVCAKCSCTTHYHYADGALECGTCGHTFDDDPPNGWRERLPAPPADPQPLPLDAFKVLQADGAEMTLMRYSREARTDPVAAIVVVHEDGSASSWGDRAAADDRKGWVRTAILAAITRITGIE